MVSSSLRRTAWIVSCMTLALLLMGGLSMVAQAQEKAADTPAADAPKADAPAAEAPKADAPKADAPAADAPKADAAAPAADAPKADAAKPAEPEIATGPTPPKVGEMGFAPEEVPFELQNNFIQMVHYYRIARLDLAANFANLVVSANPDPIVLLKLVEHRDVGYNTVVEMASSDVAELNESAKKLRAIADQGIYIKRKDVPRIQDALNRLDKGERPYELALNELRYSGEYVVPVALGIMSAGASASQQSAMERALIALDRPVVYPLILSLQSPDVKIKMAAIKLLSALGYREALPGLKAVADAPDGAAEVKAAALAAVQKIGGAEAASKPADQIYYQLAEAYYYNKLPGTDSKQPTADTWGWVAGAGLAYRPAPTSIYNDIRAARACEMGLVANPNALNLISLWVSTQMSMRAKLAVAGGGSNPWASADVPTTEFFARAIGQQYLMEALHRALCDNNTMVAVQAIQALELVANEAFLGGSATQAGAASPLVRALQYPDRLVRFGAAFAIVAAEPRKPFLGDTWVVPVLAEAVNLESGQSVLIIENNQANLNRLKGEFRGQGWNVVEATSGNEGISKARGMSRIDAILISSTIENAPYPETIQELRRDFAVTMVPVVLLSGPAERVAFSWLKSNVKFIDQVPAEAAAPAVGEKIKVLLAEAGSIALEPEFSKKVSLRAASALAFVATADLSFKAQPARPALLMAAAGKNDELAIGAMNALAQMPDDGIQQQLAEIAMTATTPKAVQIAAFKAVAQTARHIGNKLQTAAVDAIQKRVNTEKDNEIRDALGIAIGALDLPANLASQLVREHPTAQ